MDDDEIKTLKDQLALAQLENRKRVTALTQQGIQVSNDTILNVRLNMFLDIALNHEQRLAFELNFERHMADSLDNIESEVTRAKLTQGISGIPDVLAPPNNVQHLRPRG